jgi:GntR family transcriptional regulator
VNIDPQSTLHPYLQLAAWLRAQIETGAITRQLPSLAALASETGLALNTVQKAIKVLADEGTVITVPGRAACSSRVKGDQLSGSPALTSSRIMSKAPVAITTIWPPA